MTSVLEHAVKFAIASSRQRSIYPDVAAIAFRGLSRSTSDWTCRSCLAKSQISPLGQQRVPRPRIQQQRAFAVSSRRLQEDKKQQEEKTPADANETAPEPSHEDARLEPPLPAAAELNTLPSQTHKQRWDLSKRMAKVMDQLLAHASTASQRINIYTGTDYSGIEALRQDIISLEKKVRACHQEVEDSRSRHRDAHAKQASASKEIVGLLERKASWSPSDLERYMSLVRSEHTDEQAVQHAKEDLTSAERNLEETRALLERLERRQYHEEQIWSDTIRRNSTWVTFGLMGVNIILLLAQIAIFEPYRRKKIVRDVQKALDEKTVHPPNTAFQQTVDKAIEPVGVSIEEVEEKVVDAPIQQAEQAEQLEKAVPLPIDAQDDTAETQSPADDAVLATTPLVTETEEMKPVPAESTQAETSPTIRSKAWWFERWNQCRAKMDDLFSDRIVQMTQAQATTLTLEGAVAGVTIMGLAFALFRPS